jgi:hypothetical protein
VGVAASFCASLTSELLRRGLVRGMSPTEALPALLPSLVLPQVRVSTRDKRPYPTDNRYPGHTVRPTKTDNPNRDCRLFPTTRPRRCNHLRYRFTTSPRVQQDQTPSDPTTSQWKTAHVLVRFASGSRVAVDTGCAGRADARAASDTSLSALAGSLTHTLPINRLSTESRCGLPLASCLWRNQA